MAGGRRVTWGDLDVHYFDYGLGDSPAVSCGVAVRLGAALAARPEKARLRDAERHSPPRWLEPATRRALLREAGFSEGDIEAARKRIVEDQRRRIQSLPPLHYLEQLPWFVARSVRRKIRKRFQAFRDKRRAARPPGAPAPPAPPPAGLGSPGAQEAVAAAPDVVPARPGSGHEVRTLSRRLGLTGRGSSSTGNLLALAAAEEAAAEEAAAGAGPRVSFDDRADGGRARGSYRGDLDDSARWRRSRASPPPADAAGLDDSLHSLGLDGSGHSSGSGHSFGLDHSGHSLGLSGLAPDAMDASIHAPRHFLFADLAAGGEADDEPPSI